MTSQPKTKGTAMKYYQKKMNIRHKTFTKPHESHDVSGQSKENMAYIFIQVCDTKHQKWNGFQIGKISSFSWQLLCKIASPTKVSATKTDKQEWTRFMFI
eukprot:2800_1